MSVNLEHGSVVLRGVHKARWGVGTAQGHVMS